MGDGVTSTRMIQRRACCERGRNETGALPTASPIGLLDGRSSRVCVCVVEEFFMAAIGKW